VLPGLPDALYRSCRRALSLAAGDRQPTALALADELEAALGALPGGAPSHREVGAAVARLFEDVQTNTRAIVETLIGRVDAGAASVIGEALPPDAGDGSRAHPEATRQAPALSRDRPARPRRTSIDMNGMKLALVTIGVALVTYAVVAWRTSATRAPSAVARGAAGVAPDGRAAVSRDETSAALSREADRLTSAVAPAEAVAARPHVARSAPRRVPRPREPQPAPEAASAAPDDRARDCEHPFFIDADGIKRFRPECM
jgi:hypothetical protein